MEVKIRQATLADAPSYTEHMLIHIQESGIGGMIVNPYPRTHQWEKEEFKQKLIQKWSLPPMALNYEIVWIAEVEGKIVGHLDLRCGGIDAQKHRLKLGIGLENNYRSMGIGKRLMEAGIDWARQQKEITWIDLSVFSKNIVARKFYENMGFKFISIIEDALRVENESIDDVQMTLKLR